MHTRLTLIALTVAGSLQAQTRLTFTGIINESPLIDPSYHGQSVSYSILTSGDPDVSGSISTVQIQFYDEYLSNDRDLFQSITGNHLSGSWQRPADADGDPFTVFFMNTGETESQIFYMISNDAGTGIGLSFAGIALSRISINQYLNPLLASTNQSFDYATFWQQYHGSYSIGVTDGSAFVFGLLGGGEVTFNMTTLTIEPAAPIPEPSTYGLALGGLALGFAAARRRRKSA